MAEKNKTHNRFVLDERTLMLYDSKNEVSPFAIEIEEDVSRIIFKNALNKLLCSFKNLRTKRFLT